MHTYMVSHVNVVDFVLLNTCAPFVTNLIFFLHRFHILRIEIRPQKMMFITMGEGGIRTVDFSQDAYWVIIFHHVRQWGP